MNSYILGVEIGGTKLQLAIGGADGVPLYIAQGRVNAGEGAQGILRWLEGNVPGVIAKAREFSGEIAGIGVGFGGPVETAAGRVMVSNQIGGWSGFELKDWFQRKFCLPASVFNDSNAACWGEYKCGFGAGTKNFCYMNIGSGIGGGLVLGGALYDGQGFGAAEFGHTYVPDWTPAYSDKEAEVRSKTTAGNNGEIKIADYESAGFINTGCANAVSDCDLDITIPSKYFPVRAIKLELICSGWSIEKRLRHPGYVPPDSALIKLCGGDIARITCGMLGATAEGGDSFALSEIDRVARSIAIALANVLCIASPERIAMGGGVMNLGETLLSPIRRHLKEYEFISNSGTYLIEKCKLDESIVLSGAILLHAETIKRL